jgi:hypothetical protein
MHRGPGTRQPPRRSNEEKPMTHPLRLLALIAGAITIPAFAASAQEQTVLRNAAGVARIASQRAGLSMRAADTTTSPGSPQANPNRAYPPSCAAYPLPAAPSGPTYSANMSLPQYYYQYGTVESAEAVTVTVWRIACSSSGGVTPYNPTGTGYNAMTLMRIQRSAANEGQTAYYPIFPQGLAASTADASSCNTASNINCYFVRPATEPNTYLEDATNAAPIYNSTTYVLENYQGGANIAYNGAFKLWLDSGLGNYGYSVGLTTINVSAYAPTTTTYPAAFSPIPIDGYEATGWYDPTHGGEGMQVNIVDMGDNATRTFFAAWYTYSPLGLPFWITAQGTMSIGATSTGNISGYYFTNGGFAGNFDRSKLNQQTWGTLSFQFQDCNHMQFTYNGQTDATTNGPSGSGTRNWIRLTSNNGMSCE